MSKNRTCSVCGETDQTKMVIGQHMCKVCYSRKQNQYAKDIRAKAKMTTNLITETECLRFERDQFKAEYARIGAHITQFQEHIAQLQAQNAQLLQLLQAALTARPLAPVVCEQQVKQPTVAVAPVVDQPSGEGGEKGIALMSQLRKGWSPSEFIELFATRLTADQIEQTFCLMRKRGITLGKPKSYFANCAKDESNYTDNRTLAEWLEGECKRAAIAFDSRDTLNPTAQSTDSTAAIAALNERAKQMAAKQMDDCDDCEDPVSSLAQALELARSL